MHVNYFTKLSGWNIKTQKKNPTGYCCDNHLSQGQMITQGVNLLVRVSSGKFTRELDKESLLN